MQFPEAPTTRFVAQVGVAVGRADEDALSGVDLQVKRVLQASPVVVCVKTLLFLCTGNYYRSRFAEELFNHRVPHAGLSWIAKSRALAIERGISNVGSLAPFAVRALEERGLAARGANRPPQRCTITDLKAADWIVALNETEHRPLLLERFPGWEQRVEYWHVGDVDVALPAAALNSIENEIQLLLFALRQIEPLSSSN